MNTTARSFVRLSVVQGDSRVSNFRRFIKSLVVVVPAVALAVAWTGLSRANAPAGRYTVQNGTVLDTKTNLTWQQAMAPSMQTWSLAQSYCAGLSLSGTGWRAPSIKELETIVDESLTNPAIDPTAFPGTPAAFFWTSSLFAGDPSKAWSVRFTSGSSYFGAGSSMSYVRCVR